MAQQKPWQSNALTSLLNARLCLPAPEVPEDHVEAVELDAALELAPFTGTIRMPPWLESRSMTSFDEPLEKKGQRAGWKAAVIFTEFGALGSLTENTVRLQLRSDALLPSIRVKFGDSESAEGAVVFDFDPDVFGTTYQEVSPNSAEARDIFERLTCEEVELAESDTLVKISLNPSEEFGHWISKNARPPTLVKISMRGQQMHIPVVERSKLYHSRDAHLMLLRAALKTAGVQIWLPTPKNFASWNRLMLSRTLSPGEPNNMWAYTQLPLVVGDRLDKFRAFLHRRDELPVPPFLRIKESVNDWRQCAQWLSPANPRTIYPTSSCFLNVQLPALLAEYSARSRRLDGIYNLGVLHQGFVENGWEPNTVRVNIMVQGDPTIGGYLPVPRPGTLVECFLANDPDRTPSSSLRGYVEGISASGVEFMFHSPARGTSLGSHDMIVSVKKPDKELDTTYEACVQAMEVPTTFEGNGWFSIKKLLLAIPSGPAPCLFRHWQRSSSLDAEEQFLVESRLLANRATLSKTQMLAHDTLVFGRPETSCVIIRGAPGTRKTHTLCTILDSVNAMGYKVLLAAKSDNTVDGFTARAVKRLGCNRQVRRFFTPGAYRAYASTRMPSKLITEAQNEKSLAWGARVTEQDAMEGIAVCCCSVFDAPTLTKAGFHPDIVIVDEMSLVTEAELCTVLVAASGSLRSVVLAGDPHQPQDPLASEGTSPFHSQLAFQPLQRFLAANKELSAVCLQECYRLPAELGEFTNKLLPPDERLVFMRRDESPLVKKVWAALRSGRLPFGIAYQRQREFFINVNSYSRQQPRGHSYTNDAGVQLIVDSVQNLVQLLGVGQNDIAVITLYSYDAVCLRRELRSRGLSLVDVSVTTRYNGRERPIVFAHSPKAEPPSSIVTTADVNPFGIAMEKQILLLHTSRAVDMAFYVGNFNNYRQLLNTPDVKRMKKKYDNLRLWIDHIYSSNRLV